jgi:hypothetical protein
MEQLALALAPTRTDREGETPAGWRGAIDWIVGRFRRPIQPGSDYRSSPAPGPAKGVRGHRGVARDESETEHRGIARDDPRHRGQRSPAYARHSCPQQPPLAGRGQYPHGGNADDAGLARPPRRRIRWGRPSVPSINLPRRRSRRSGPSWSAMRASERRHLPVRQEATRATGWTVPLRHASRYRRLPGPARQVVSGMRSIRVMCSWLAADRAYKSADSCVASTRESTAHRRTDL